MLTLLCVLEVIFHGFQNIRNIDLTRQNKQSCMGGMGQCNIDVCVCVREREHMCGEIIEIKGVQNIGRLN